MKDRSSDILFLINFFLTSLTNVPRRLSLKRLHEILVKQPPAETPSKTYTFDLVFGPETNQARIFDHVVIPILREVKD